MAANETDDHELNAPGQSAEAPSNSIYFNHYLAKVAGGCEVRVGVACLVEREDAINDGMYFGHADETVKVFEHPTAADEDAGQALGTPDQCEGIQLAAEAANAADDGNRAAHPGARN